MNASLDRRLAELARTPVLLVGTDYDGTLAEIVDDPAAAVPTREALVALHALTESPATHVAVISGRALADLANRVGHPDGIHLIGSHGGEFEPGFASDLPSEQSLLRSRLMASLYSLASCTPGAVVEEKPAGAAFHYRQVAREDVEALKERLEQLADANDGPYLRHGKEVVELSLCKTDKGEALATLRQRFGATAVLFLGDDTTDEDAFGRLFEMDVGVKVGDGETLATERVSGPWEVARTLARLCELRRAFTSGADASPIESHSFLSDQRAVALCDPEATISWMCAPRIDSPAIFAELLGGPTAGRFAIRPIGATTPPVQQYVEDSLVLESRWPGLRLVDYLDCTDDRPRRRAGRTDLVRVLEGRGTVEVEFAPRLDFGRVRTQLVPRPGGLEVRGMADPLVLYAPGVMWAIAREGPHDTARARIELADGPLALELRYGTARLEASEASETERRLGTMAYFSRWLGRLRLPDQHPDAVRTSALVLNGLFYRPTGSFAAAATTSLPESLGGLRNWDYRFCWLRDAALSADALLALGSEREAMKYLDWVLTVVERAPSPDRLRPLYTVTGHEVWPEAEIAELSGYAGSRPVRVGNGAAQQVQLDVFGPIVDLVWKLAEAGAPVSSEHWRLVEALVEAVRLRWTEPDHGIWEVRTPPRHHVHSKVMCWLTVDRALRLRPHFRSDEHADWAELAATIRADVLKHGWKEHVGAFTSAYESDELDAAALFVGSTGLLEPNDPRFIATIEAVERELRVGPTVYRYRCDDGLPGDEGGFHLCTSWLIEAYRLVGRRDDADELLESQLALAGPTGLFPEEWCPKLGRALGNHPQAYSHIGIIKTVLAASPVHERDAVV